jgi:hypothetical protein
MGTMAIKCQIILVFSDPKSLRIMSIKASMVRPKDMAKTSRTYKMVLSINEGLSF